MHCKALDQSIADLDTFVLDITDIEKLLPAMEEVDTVLQSPLPGKRYSTTTLSVPAQLLKLPVRPACRK